MLIHQVPLVSQPKDRDLYYTIFAYIYLQMQQAMKSIEYHRVHLCSHATQYFESLYTAGWEDTTTINTYHSIEDSNYITSVAISLISICRTGKSCAQKISLSSHVLSFNESRCHLLGTRFSIHLVSVLAM